MENLIPLTESQVERIAWSLAQSSRPLQRGIRTDHSSVKRLVFFPISAPSLNHTIGMIDLSNPLVPNVTNQQIATVPTDGDRVRLAQHCSRDGTTVTRESSPPGSRYGLHNVSARIETTNCVTDPLSTQ